MVFSSTVFLFLFLPVVWLLYLLIGERHIIAQNILLCAASLVFYAYGEPVYIAIMLFSVLFNYCAALGIDAARTNGDIGRRHFLTVFAVIINLLILGFFKYVPWLLSLLPMTRQISFTALSLPVGISFYTFQVLSYVLDVSRGEGTVQKNYFNLLLYISFFPQLIAGPIVAYEDIRPQLTDRTVTAEKTARGIRRFVWGLSKKLLISNTAAWIADAAFAAQAPSAALAWLGAGCYSLQIYYDFSGYSDMAIGLASMFGFQICENFNYPYAAVTIRDFWKRWHISLTAWFRRYVYIPLGGNRCSAARTVFNRIFVFFLTGLWHGANFTYILWGLWHGFLMMFERAIGLDRAEQGKTLGMPLRFCLRVYTLLCVMLGFVMFRAESVGAGIAYIRTMFSFHAASAGGLTAALSLVTPYAAVMLLFGVICSAPVLPYLRRRLCEKGHAALCDAASSVVCVPLYLLCVMTLASSAFNPFIYYIF